MGMNNKTCNKCWNWEILRAECTKEVIDSIGRYYNKPFKLSMKMQKQKSQEICNLIVDGKINISIGKARLKVLCLSEEAIKLIIDSAIVRHAIQTSTLEMHDLNRFHHLIDRSNINGVGHPDFAICRRKNLTHEKLSGSPMHILNFGKKNHLLT